MKGEEESDSRILVLIDLVWYIGQGTHGRERLGKERKLQNRKIDKVNYEASTTKNKGSLKCSTYLIAMFR